MPIVSFQDIDKNNRKISLVPSHKYEQIFSVHSLQKIKHEMQAQIGSIIPLDYTLLL